MMRRRRRGGWGGGGGEWGGYEEEEENEKEEDENEEDEEENEEEEEDDLCSCLFHDNLNYKDDFNYDYILLEYDIVQFGTQIRCLHLYVFTVYMELRILLKRQYASFELHCLTSHNRVSSAW